MTLPADLELHVLNVLAQIRPAIQEDGGDLELVSIDEDATVRIRFLGACIGCPSSQITLRDGIARNLREAIPEVREVIAVE
jgi:Fe-S cluster biogenesis protein NfuA|tara:strand:- start:115 stop:357 length:243 start_codon:yes stop_codon:yes gene_type:complete